MSSAVALIGVDWGTHSSKWTRTWCPLDSVPQEGPFKILRSEVRLAADGERLHMSVDPPPHGTVCASEIKGQLIKNPQASFWAGPQRHIRLTLGELVVFSLWSLLGEAYENMCQILGEPPQGIDIRFSLPNWVDIAEGAVGRACYEQAARGACYCFAQDRDAWARCPTPTHGEWQHLVDSALRTLGISDESVIDAHPEGFRLMISREYTAAQNIKFRFVAESSAAGLAGLRRAAWTGEGTLRKILVVDVGAGSTDIGYVLRSTAPRDIGGGEVLCQLPPANTCRTAGRDLSQEIREIYRSQGREVSLDQAEAIKTGGQESEWLSHPAVREWTRRIAEHARAYIRGIPDQRFFPEAPGLMVLVTGGSGVVPGLRERILAAAVDALRERGTPEEVITATAPLTLALEGPGARDANRLAVALGAASEELPRLSYHERLGPRAGGGPPRRMPPSWTGR